VGDEIARLDAGGDLELAGRPVDAKLVDDGKKLEVVQGVPLNDFAKGKIAGTVNELKEEREMVKELIPA
jgi:hypothetical protein